MSVCELLPYIERGFRSFHTDNIGSIGQRGAKLLAVKVGGLKKKYAAMVITAEVCASTFVPGSSAPGFYCARVQIILKVLRLVTW